MKTSIKTVKIILLGLLTATLIYPFSHESGHSIFAIICGGRILEFNLFPIPNILCDMTDDNVISFILIGSGGMIFPFFLSAVTHPRSFAIWYINLMLMRNSLQL